MTSRRCILTTLNLGRRAALIVVATMATNCSGSEGTSATAGDSGNVDADGGTASGKNASDSNACASSQSLCGSVCANEQTDSNNCGSCGHHCLGGTCGAGVCQPVVLASGQSSPFYIALDTLSVYWTNEASSGANAQAMKCAKSGCDNTPAVLWSGPFGLEGIAVQPPNVYWTADGTTGQVMQCPVTGCTASSTLVAGQPIYVNLIAVNMNDVFWLDANGYLVTCAVSGCANTPSTFLQNDMAVQLAVDERNLYWTTGNGQVDVCSVSGCNGSPTVLASGQAMPNSLVVDATNVYWVNLGPPSGAADLMVPYYTTGQIMKCAISGCNNNPTVLATVASAWLGAIAVDATNVYWTSAASTTTAPTSPNGQIMMCSTRGCGGSPTVLAVTDTIPSNGIGGARTQPIPGLAVDDTRIYWTDPAAGKIFALAK